MQEGIFLVWCFLPLLVLFYSTLNIHKRAAIVRKHIRHGHKNTKGDFYMLNLIAQFIGKKCYIITIEKEYTGVIESVEENWIVVQDSNTDTKEIINLEYVTGIRQCKEKAKKAVKIKENA